MSKVKYIDGDIEFYAEDKEQFSDMVHTLDRGICPPYGDWRFKGVGWYLMYLITCPHCGSDVEYISYLGLELF